LAIVAILQVNKNDELLGIAIELSQAAGRSILSTYGVGQGVEKKGDNSNVVTAADTRSEGIIVRGIRQKFPGHSIIAEEAGCALRASEYTWVVDPLDGTSNYAAGIPWFGVLICVLRGKELVAGVLHIPVSGDLYAAEAGAGAYKNGKRISVTEDRKLADVLWAYGMDGGGSASEAARNVALLARLLRRVRNIRTTNSLIDAAYTADGRLGGMINQSTRLWDIAAPMLIVQEAGGCYTDVVGQPLDLDLSAIAGQREYSILAGAPALHEEVAAMARATLGTLN
jgi:myo-inositol-1(or 4)-monophosphatase